MQKYISKKKLAQLPEFVILKIQVRFNTTRIDVTNKQGNVLIWKTSRSVGFKHSKKSTPLAAATVVKNACSEAFNRGARLANIEIFGIGVGRSAAMKKSLESDLKISEIKHVVKIAHNGVRQKKARRV
jgi:small subunit ribosomal protein S11